MSDADPKGIIIGHQNNSEDIDYPLSELKKPGFFSAFDRTNLLMSPKAEDNTISLVKQWCGNRNTLSHDCITAWLGRPKKPSTNWADWNPLYVHRRLLPKMRAAGITDGQIEVNLVGVPGNCSNGFEGPVLVRTGKGFHNRRDQSY